jgi:fucose permease
MFGYLCVEWTVGAAMGCMVGGPALLAIAQQIGIVTIVTTDYNESLPVAALNPNYTMPAVYDTSDIGDMGLATAALALGNLVGSIVGGPMVDKMVEWNRVVVGAVLLNGISIGWVPYVTRLWQLVAASFLNGLAIGVIEPMLNVGCVRLWPAERSAPLMQLFASTFGIGIFCSPAIIAVDLARSGSFHTAYKLIALLVCCTAIPPIVMRSPQARLPEKEDETAAGAVPAPTKHATGLARMDIASEMEEAVDEDEDEFEEQQQDTNDEAQLHELLLPADTGSSSSSSSTATTNTATDNGAPSAELPPGTPNSQKEFAVKGLVAFVIMCYCGAEASFGAWISTYVVAMGSSTEAGGAFLASLFWGSFTAGRVLGIPLSLRFSPAQILAADLCVALVVLLILLKLGMEDGTHTATTHNELRGLVGGADGGVGGVGADNYTSTYPLSDEGGAPHTTDPPDERALQILTAVFGLSMACTYPQAKVLPSTYGYAIDGKYMSVVMVAGSLGNVLFVRCFAFKPSFLLAEDMMYWIPRSAAAVWSPHSLTNSLFLWDVTLLEGYGRSAAVRQVRA